MNSHRRKNPRATEEGQSALWATTQGNIAVRRYRAACGRPATPIPHGLGASHAALPQTHHEEVNSRPKSPNRRNRVNTKEATTKPTSDFSQVMLTEPSTPMNW
jgi:hypothetical protein